MLGNLQLATVLAFIVKWEDLQNVLVSTLVFVALGLIIFALAFFFITVVAPFSVKKEIEQDHNMALAVVIGSIIIGIAIIIAAAISG
jgi:putative membrane protein